MPLDWMRNLSTTKGAIASAQHHSHMDVTASFYSLAFYTGALILEQKGSVFATLQTQSHYGTSSNLPQARVFNGRGFGSATR